MTNALSSSRRSFIHNAKPKRNPNTCYWRAANIVTMVSENYGGVNHTKTIYIYGHVVAGINHLNRVQSKDKVCQQIWITKTNSNSFLRHQRGQINHKKWTYIYIMHRNPWTLGLTLELVTGTRVWRQLSGPQHGQLVRNNGASVKILKSVKSYANLNCSFGNDSINHTTT